MLCACMNLPKGNTLIYIMNKKNRKKKDTVQQNGWKKYDPTIFFLQRTQITYNDKGGENYEGKRGIIKISIKGKVSILRSDEVDFQANKITRYSKGYYVTINEPIHQEDLSFLNMCVPNYRMQNT